MLQDPRGARSHDTHRNAAERLVVLGVAIHLKKQEVLVIRLPLLLIDTQESVRPEGDAGDAQAPACSGRAAGAAERKDADPRTLAARLSRAHRYAGSVSSVADYSRLGRLLATLTRYRTKTSRHAGNRRTFHGD